MIVRYVLCHDEIFMRIFRMLSWCLFSVFLGAFALTGLFLFWLSAFAGFVICQLITFLIGSIVVNND